jgi:hypothetical protein
MISEANAKQLRLNGLMKTLRSYVQFNGDKAGYQRPTTKITLILWRWYGCAGRFSGSTSIVDRHPPQNDDPPKPLPKTVHQFDARFDDSKTNRSLAFEPNYTYGHQ